jgi:hypothetical protein
VTLNYGLGKAIGYDETGFLGRGDDAYRRQAWNFIFAGGSAFDSLDYSFTPGHEDGTDAAPNGPGGGSTALRRQLGILAGFLAKLPLVELAPDEHAVVRADGAAWHALSSPAGVYAIYLDGSGSSRLTLRLPAGKYMGMWVDTVSGGVTQIPGFKQTAEETVLDAPEYSNGIAVWLEKVLY